MASTHQRHGWNGSCSLTPPHIFDFSLPAIWRIICIQVMFKVIQKHIEKYARKYLAKHKPKLILVTGSVGKPVQNWQSQLFCLKNTAYGCMKAIKIRT